MCITPVYQHPIAFSATPSNLRTNTMSSQRNPRESIGNNNAAAVPAQDVGGVPAVASTALVESLTNAITAVVNAATAASSSPTAAAKKTQISTLINPYYTELMNLSLKEGKHYWQMVTQREKDGNSSPPSLITRKSSQTFSRIARGNSDLIRLCWFPPQAPAPLKWPRVPSRIRNITT